MKILPTIHLHDGRVCIRPGGSAVLEDPWKLLDELLDQGWHRLVLKDLDALRGASPQRELMARLMKHCLQRMQGKCCLMVGGGIRSSDEAQFFLDHGATWLTIGSSLLSSPVIVDQLLARFRDSLIPVLASRDGMLEASGWNAPFLLSAPEMARRVQELGFRRLLFLDLTEDPALPPDLATARCVAEAARLPLFMGGPFTGRESLERARTACPFLQGFLVDPSRMAVAEVAEFAAAPCH